MNALCVGTAGKHLVMAELRMPRLDLGSTSGDEPAVAPVKEPATVPVEPDIAPEPNTVPHRPAVPEPDVAPCERPDTSCPVHR